MIAALVFGAGGVVLMIGATMTIASRRAEALPSALRQYNELWRDARHLRRDYEQQPDSPGRLEHDPCLARSWLQSSRLA
jgi:hypothetical protein